MLNLQQKQQRLTTVCVIIAALRDVAELVAEQHGGDEARAAAANLAATTNAALYHADDWFDKYREDIAAGDEHREEELLEWLYGRLAFLPTHDDRSSFAAAVLPLELVPPGLGRPNPLPAGMDVDQATEKPRSAVETAESQLLEIFHWAAGSDTAKTIDRTGFAKLLRLMGHIRQVSFQWKNQLIFY